MAPLTPLPLAPLPLAPLTPLASLLTPLSPLTPLAPPLAAPSNKKRARQWLPPSPPPATTPPTHPDKNSQQSSNLRSKTATSAKRAKTLPPLTPIFLSSSSPSADDDTENSNSNSSSSSSSSINDGGGESVTNGYPEVCEDDWIFTQEIDALTPLAKRFLAGKHLELEGRLGVFSEVAHKHGPNATNATRKHFFSGVDAEYFQSIFTELGTCETWGEVALGEQSVDWSFADDVRHTQMTRTRPPENAPPVGEERNTIRKTTLETLNMPVSERPFSLRIRLSEEVPLTSCPQMESKAPLMVRLKMRESFTTTTTASSSYPLPPMEEEEETAPKEEDFFHMRYDLTRVNSGPSVRHACEQNAQFGVEHYEVELEVLKTKAYLARTARARKQTLNSDARNLAATMVHRLVQLLGLFNECDQPVPITIQETQHITHRAKPRAAALKPLTGKEKDIEVTASSSSPSSELPTLLEISQLAASISEQVASVVV